GLEGVEIELGGQRGGELVGRGVAFEQIGVEQIRVEIVGAGAGSLRHGAPQPGQCDPAGTNGTILARSAGGSRASRMPATSSGRYSWEKCIMSTRSVPANSSGRSTISSR